MEVTFFDESDVGQGLDPSPQIRRLAFTDPKVNLLACLWTAIIECVC